MNLMRSVALRAIPFHITHFLPHSFLSFLHLKFVDNLRIRPKESMNLSDKVLLSTSSCVFNDAFVCGAVMPRQAPVQFLNLSGPSSCVHVVTSSAHARISYGSSLISRDHTEDNEFLHKQFKYHLVWGELFWDDSDGTSRTCHRQ